MYLLHHFECGLHIGKSIPVSEQEQEAGGSPSGPSPCFCGEGTSGSLRPYVITASDFTDTFFRAYVLLMLLYRANPSSCTLTGGHVATVQKKDSTEGWSNEELHWSPHWVFSGVQDSFGFLRSWLTSWQEQSSASGKQHSGEKKKKKESLMRCILAFV